MAAQKANAPIQPVVQDDLLKRTPCFASYIAYLALLFHRITGPRGWEGPSGDHAAQPPAGAASLRVPVK